MFFYFQCQKTCETYGAFTCRSISYDMVTGICSLSGSDMSTTSTKMLKSHENKVYAQRVPCIDSKFIFLLCFLGGWYTGNEHL